MQNQFQMMEQSIIDQAAKSPILPPINQNKPVASQIGQVMGQMKDLYLESQNLERKTDESLVLQQLIWIKLKTEVKRMYFFFSFQVRKRSLSKLKSVIVDSQHNQRSRPDMHLMISLIYQYLFERKQSLPVDYIN